MSGYFLFTLQMLHIRNENESYKDIIHNPHLLFSIVTDGLGEMDVAKEDHSFIL